MLKRIGKKMFFRRKPLFQATQSKPMVAKLPSSQSAIVEGRLEPHSPTWLFVKDWAEKRLAEAREYNDRLSNGLELTSATRGRIKILKELIELPVEKDIDIGYEQEQDDLDSVLSQRRY